MSKMFENVKNMREVQPLKLQEYLDIWVNRCESRHHNIETRIENCNMGKIEMKEMKWAGVVISNDE